MINASKSVKCNSISPLKGKLKKNDIVNLQQTKHAITLYTIFQIILFSPQLSLGQWIKTNSPAYGGSIFSLTSNGAGNVFAGTNGNGVFRTMDNGKNWDLASDGLPGYATALISMDSILFTNGGYNSIYRSMDQGKSWQAVNSGLPEKWSVTCFAVVNNKIFAGTDYGVLFSNDSGTSWNQLNNGLPPTDAAVYSFAVLGSDLFAQVSGSAGLYRLAGGSSEWVPVDPEFKQIGNSIELVATHGKSIIAVNQYSGPFVSVDSGKSWIPADSGLPQAESYIRGFVSLGNYLFAGTRSHGIFISENNGRNWINTGLKSVEIVSLTSSYGRLYAGTNSGIFISEDTGKTWKSSNSGLNAINIKKFAVRSNELYALTDRGNIFSSADEGQSWVKKDSGLPFISSFCVNDSCIFACSEGDLQQGGNVYCSFNNGSDWMHRDSGIKYNSSRINEIVSLDNYIFVSTKANFTFGSSTTFFTANNGMSWEPLQTTPLGGMYFTTNDTKLLTGGSGVIALSEDYGATWRMMTNIGSSWIKQIATKGNNIFVINKLDSIYHSIDGGNSWSNFNDGLPPNIIKSSLLIIGTDIYIGTSNGVFSTRVNGTTWNSVNAGLPSNSNVTYMAMMGTNVFASIQGRGIWRLPLTDLSVFSETRSVRDQNRLLARSINRNIEIKFLLGNEGRILIGIYNIKGQLISKITSGYYKSGLHSLIWNPSSIPDGNYVVAVRSSTGLYTIMVQLIR